jgi:hypothetical protein
VIVSVSRVAKKSHRQTQKNTDEDKYYEVRGIYSCIQACKGDVYYSQRIHYLNVRLV